MYKEIEFVCHNTDYKDSTPLENLIGLYKNLMELVSMHHEPEIFPYVCDHSDDNTTQVSLAVVVYRSWAKWFPIIMERAEKFSVAIDLIGETTPAILDSAVRSGEILTYDQTIVLGDRV